MKPLIFDFQSDIKGLYSDHHMEIRLVNSQVRFYEVNNKTRKEYCLSKDCVKWLIHKGSIPKKEKILKALKGDKSIFT